jgi:hypothetical protein
MYSPTNFVVSSEIGGMSTRGQHRRSATIDIQRLDPLHRNWWIVAAFLWHQLRTHSALATP